MLKIKDRSLFFYGSLLFFIFFSFSTQIAVAKLFRNAYMSFELPPKWKCTLEATDWVCVSEFYEKNREAMILLTAKEVGPSDNLQTYISHLNMSRNLPNVIGKQIPSQVIGVKNRVINNHVWIDGMHLGSEITSYYTRYLATVKDSIAILVTFSAQKTNYTKYSQDFLRAIQSLQVVATKSMLGEKSLSSIRGSNETLGTPIGQSLPTEIMINNDPPPEGSGKGKIGSTLFGLILLAICALYYFLFIHHKKGKKKK